MTPLMNSILGVADQALDALRTSRVRDWPVAALFAGPALGLLGLFGVAPLIYALYMSLFSVRRGETLGFTGLGNYTEALGSSGFWNSLFVTIYYAAGTIPVSLVLSFLIASALHRIVRGRGFFRTVYFLPYVTSTVAAATVWRVILNPQGGLVNAFLRYIGFESTPFSQWLLEPKGVLHLATGGFVPVEVGPSLALCCIIAFEIWHSTGFMIVVFLAGLTALPRELEESARLDGANWLQVTRSITLPLLSPTTFFLAVVSVIKAFQAFDSFYALTENGLGPARTTETMTVHIFANFYLYGRQGYGAAIATLLALAIVGLTVVQWRFLGRRVHYE